MELSFMTQTGVDDMKTHVEEHAELYRCEDNAAMLAHLTEKGYLQKADLDALSFVELLEEGDHGVASTVHGARSRPMRQQTSASGRGFRTRSSGATFIAARKRISARARRLRSEATSSSRRDGVARSS